MTRSFKSRLPLLAASISLVAVLACGGGAGAPAASPAAKSSGSAIELTYTTYLTESAGFSQRAREYMAELEKRTNGAVKATRWNYAEALCKTADHLKCVATGTADIAFLAPSYTPADLPYSTMTDMVYASDKAGAGALTREELWQTHAGYQDEFKRNKVYPLYFHADIPTIIGTNFVVNSAADLKGKKYRAYGPMNDLLSGAGLTPVGMSAAEIYEALQRGVIQGFTGYPLWLTHTAKLHEVTKTYIDPGIGVYGGAALVMNLDTYERLPDTAKKAIADLRIESIHRDVDLIMKEEDAALEAAKNAGVTLYRFTDAEKQMWRDAVPPEQIFETYYKEREAKVPDIRQFWAKFLEIIKQKEPQSKYKSAFEKVGS